MKIAIVVHGRLHAFDLAAALLKRGHDVTLLTNYPKWAVAKFHIPGAQIRSFPAQGVLHRVTQAAHNRFQIPFPEAFIHRLFGAWAARELGKSSWDWVYSFTGVSEELLRALTPKGTICLLVRGSSHIRAQARILEEECIRTSSEIDRPTAWMIGRDEREYALATRIITTSSFVYRTFVEQGVPPERLVKIPMGVNVRVFQAPAEVVEARIRRILSGEPLRILYVGALSMRKGFWDMLPIMSALPAEKFVFRCIGPIAPDMGEVLPKLRRYAELVPRQPHHELPQWYAQSDLFLFPTIEDGFPAVLSQAQANALPALTTPHCSGPDIIADGENGWILPIRSPESFIERLWWCDGHRQELAAMVRTLHVDFKPRSFDDAARDLEESVRGILQ